VGGAWQAPFIGSDIQNNNSFFLLQTDHKHECHILLFPLLQIELTCCVTFQSDEDVEDMCGVVAVGCGTR
jgi:hypothetical protein